MIPFDENREAFQDEVFEKFVDKVRVKDIRTAFFHKNGGAYWTAFVSYEGLPEKLARPADLSEAQLDLYDALREWRNHKAADEGIPPYLIAYNGFRLCNTENLPERGQFKDGLLRIFPSRPCPALFAKQPNIPLFRRLSAWPCRLNLFEFET